MKSTIFKSILALVIAFMALPMMGQDFMNIYFKNGDFRKFYLKNVTEITTSKFDANGIQHNDYDYQHITTFHHHYVYNLNDIDSISFSKFYEDLAKQNFAMAMNEIVPLLSYCESAEDANNQIYAIKSATGVEDAWCDGAELYVKVKNGFTMSFHFNHDGKDNGYKEVSANRVMNSLNSIIPKLPKQIVSNNRKWTAVIANQTHFDEDGAKKSAKKDLYSLKEYMGQCNIDTLYLSKPSIDFFVSDIFKYDIIVLLVHGGYKKGQHAFITGDELGKVKKHFWQMNPSQEEQDKWSDKFYKVLENEKLDRDDITDQDIYFTWVEEERDGDSYWVAYPKIFESLYDKIEGGLFENDKSIMFWASCHSLEGGNSFADKFFERKLGTFLGYDNIVSFYTAPPAALNFFEHLLKGKSLYTAFSDLPYRYIHDLYTLGASELLMETNPNQSENYYNSTFITNTVTDKISNELVFEQFNASNLVEIKGFTTTLDPDAISMGFIYGTDENLISATDVNDVEVTVLPKPLDNGNGNVIFRGKLTNLKPNNTYYYCAYTNDGTFYNYGKPESFTLYEKISLSSNTITVSALTSSSVQITSGSGSYSIESIIPSGIVTASIFENKSVAIEANTPGTAVITVKDNITGETATITVTVTGIVDTRELMFTKKVGSTVYSMYKKTLSDNDYHINPDGWKCYRSELSLDITKNGKTDSYVVDNNIYLDKKYDHHGGQQPCMLLDFNKNMMYIFCNSKDDGPYYSMDGNFYSSSMNNIHFSKETVFEGANWGWYPYFCDYGDDNIYLCNFSYAGYFTIMAVREGGTWELYYYNTDISPEQATREWEIAGPVLVIGNPEEEIDEPIPS